MMNYKPLFQLASARMDRTCLFVSFMILVVYMWQGFSYGVIGDARLYVNEAVRLGDGYFSQNAGALAGRPDAEHLVLVTEGGYQFLIAGLRALFGLRSVFWLHRFLLPLLIAFFLCIPLLLGKKASAWALFPALCFLVWHEHLVEDVLLLRRPLRALPGHVLAMWLCWEVLSAENVTSKRCFLWGFLAGFSAWFNFPTILFGLVPTVRILLDSGKDLKKIIQFGAILAIAALAGLLPLFAQNLFEGKAFYVIGEMDFLVTAEKPPLPKPYRHLPVEFGLHPGNFRWIFPEAVRYLFGTSSGPIWNTFLAIGGVGLLVFKPKSCLLLLAGIVPTFLFYCMFHGFISRYFLIPHLLLVSAASAGLVEIGRCGLFRRLPVQNVFLGILAIFLSVVSFAKIDRLHSRHEPSTSFRYEDLVAFGDWIDATADEDSLYITRFSQLTGWLNWTANRIRSQTHWVWSAKGWLSQDDFKFVYKDIRNYEFSGLSDEERVAAVHEQINEGREVVFLHWTQGEHPPYSLSSWWKGDLAAHFYLDPTSPEFTFPSGYPFGLKAYRLTPFPEKQIYPLAKRGKDQNRLLVFAGFPENEELLERPARIQVIQPSTGQVVYQDVWRPGYHLLDIPSLEEEEGLELHIQGKRPQPALVQWSRSDQLWGRYTRGKNLEMLPMDVRMIQPVIARWKGSKDWARDGASDPVNLVRNRYRIRLSADQMLQLPTLPNRGIFHLLLYRKGEERPIQEWVQSLGLTHPIGEEHMMVTLLTKHGVQKTDSTLPVGEANLLVSGLLQHSDQPPKLQLQLDPHVFDGDEPERWEIRGLFFQELPDEWTSVFAVNPEPVPLIVSADGVGPAGPWEAIEESDYRLVYLSCTQYAPEGIPPKGWVKLHIGSWGEPRTEGIDIVLLGDGDRKTFHVRGDQLERDSSMILIPYQEPWEKILINTSSAHIREAPLLYVSSPMLVPSTSDGYLPQNLDLFSKEGQHLFHPKGFYDVETLPDGERARWSSGQSSFRIPLPVGHDLGHSKVLQFLVRGPIRPASPTTLKVSFSPSHNIEVALPSWEEGWVPVQVPLPAGVWTENELRVKLSGPSWKPADVMESTDQRNLSFYLRRVQILMQEEDAGELGR